jgi:GTP-binding protein HflX
LILRLRKEKEKCMAEAFEMEELQEKLILVGVGEQNGDDVNESLDELEELVETTGAVVCGRIVQNLEIRNNATYVGSGKIQEIAELIEQTGATGIVCDDELSPAQLKNLDDALNVKIMDRTLVILDIFAARASTSEGKIQVELAQLKYRASRLSGLGVSMSRLGGGIGTRGPGEKKLEIDRRLIRDRISQLNKELKVIQKHRDVTRAQRKRNNIPVIAIVGYTNAGKSTLLNHLTDATVLEEDKLFATLDPTTRLLELDAHQQVLLTDTVGFIRKLPHNLIEAFKSTLEEAKYADYIFHVVDSSNVNYEHQMETVYQTLDELEVKDKTIITLFNKQDKRTDKEPLRDFRAEKTLLISAVKDQGLDEIKEVIVNLLRDNKIYIERIIPYQDAGIIQLVRKQGELVSEEYVPEGIAIKAYVPMEVYGKLPD